MGGSDPQSSRAVSLNICFLFSCFGVLVLTILAVSLVSLVDVKALGLRLENGGASSSSSSGSGSHGASGSHTWTYKDSATGPENWGKLKVGILTGLACVVQSLCTSKSRAEQSQGTRRRQTCTPAATLLLARTIGGFLSLDCDRTSLPLSRSPTRYTGRQGDPALPRVQRAKAEPHRHSARLCDTELTQGRGVPHEPCLWRPALDLAVTRGPEVLVLREHWIVRNDRLG